MPIKQIAVLWAGTMGHGIAYAAIAGGYETRMFDVSEASLAKGRGAIDGIIAKGVELGKVQSADADTMRKRLTTTASIGNGRSERSGCTDLGRDRDELLGQQGRDWFFAGLDTSLASSAAPRRPRSRARTTSRRSWWRSARTTTR